ncbi:hypothetical protein [Streptosporangium sp. LJ11]|uniref:hypothetical protein n=1 Tax=Streptosporangium sp. LJ11 TaxID=3436927 RepID=UPI003F79D5F0
MGARGRRSRPGRDSAFSFVHGEAGRASRLEHIETDRTGMRPKSLIARMDDAS